MKDFNRIEEGEIMLLDDNTILNLFYRPIVSKAQAGEPIVACIVNTARADGPMSR